MVAVPCNRDRRDEHYNGKRDGQPPVTERGGFIQEFYLAPTEGCARERSDSRRAEQDHNSLPAVMGDSFRSTLFHLHGHLPLCPSPAARLDQCSAAAVRPIPSADCIGSQ